VVFAVCVHAIRKWWRPALGVFAVSRRLSIPTADPAVGSCGFCSLARTPQPTACMLRWATARPELDVRVESDCTACAPLTRLIRLIARGIVGCQRSQWHERTRCEAGPPGFCSTRPTAADRSSMQRCGYRADMLPSNGDDDVQLSGKTRAFALQCWCTGLAGISNAWLALVPRASFCWPIPEA
jgi:hypothetical protein